MWHLLEPLHAVTYFAPEARATADAAGMRGFWMGYVAQRVAPLGAVGPAVAESVFFGFHRDRLLRALPDAWGFTSPGAALQARSEGAVVALRGVADGVLDPHELREAADLAGRAALGADTAGRVLAASNRALTAPADPWAGLWQAATTLREHRGDGHVAVLVAQDLSPIAAHLLKAGAGEAPADVLRESRAWPHDEWDHALGDLRARGLVTEVGRLTDAGRERHVRVEEATDGVAEGPWRALGPQGTERLAALLTPLTAAVLAAGLLPVPNPIGLVPEPTGDPAQRSSTI